MDKRTCSIGGCSNPHFGNGWCNKHYKKWRKYGDPEALVERRGRPLYPFNEHFFDQVATEEQAYWLGFIAADGCVTGGKRPNRLVVKLKESDAGHLEKLKAALGADHPLLYSARRGVAGPCATLAVASPHLRQSLAELGITPRKSTVLVPWEGPPELMRHYWRGMVDGDGHIGKHGGRENWTVDLCGSEACVLAFMEWARPISGSASAPRFGSNVWHWAARGLAAPQALARELYDGASVYLDRKYALAQELLSKPIRARSWRGQVCIKDGCDAEAHVMGMCKNHYRAMRQAVAEGPQCTVEGCPGKQIAGGYCPTHYQRDRRHGDPLRVDRGRAGSRRYALNESFFDVIDTAEKAYWLGFIAAVGRVVRSSKTFQLRMELGAGNEGHLIRLRDALGSDKPLRYRSGKKVGNLAGVTFDSWRLAEALERHGVTTRNGMTVTPWTGPDDLMAHFEQGFAEGKRSA